MLLEIMAWFVASCVFMSLAEWTAHRYMMHRHFLKLSFMNVIYQKHAILHHRKFYKKFNEESDVVGRWINIKLDYWMGWLVGAPLFIGLWLASPTGAIIFFSVVNLHHFLWNVFHTEMHIPKNGWLSRTLVYRMLARYHWMHHKYPGKNYNVVFPLFDFLMGTYLKPSEKDNKQMAVIGL